VTSGAPGRDRIYLVWATDLPTALEGPWREVRHVAPGVAFVDSTDTLSAVYHAIKWQLADDAALVVAPVGAMPKSRGLAPGTTAWLRRRASRIARDSG
jgi:hypothetical protein